MRVTKEDLTGEIKDFPLEVVQKMCEHQVQQGNEFNPKVFADGRQSNKTDGGFTWKKTEEGMDFWDGVIMFEDFRRFFKEYSQDLDRDQMETALELRNYYLGGKKELGKSDKVVLDSHFKEDIPDFGLVRLDNTNLLVFILDAETGFGFDEEGNFLPVQPIIRMDKGFCTRATEQDLENFATLLKQEAAKKGLTKGAKYKSLETGKVLEVSEEYKFKITTDSVELITLGGAIMRNGKWAEPLEERPKDLDYTIKEMAKQLKAFGVKEIEINMKIEK